MKGSDRIGTISVDFAGTREEAKEFVRKNGDKFPNGLTMGRGGAEHSPNGDLTLFGRYKNIQERRSVSAMFDALGWDKGSQNS